MYQNPNYWNNIYSSTPSNESTWKAVSIHFKTAARLLNPKSKVLDIGCGDGRHSIALSELGHDVTAIDFSEEAIRRAKKIAQTRNVFVKFICSDILFWEPNNKYDFILCSGVLNSIPTQHHTEIISRLQDWTIKEGLNQVVSFIDPPNKRDVSGLSVFNLDLNFLLNSYSSWQRVAYHEYQRTHTHHGTGVHTHFITNILAAKGNEWKYEIK